MTDHREEQHTDDRYRNLRRAVGKSIAERPGQLGADRGTAEEARERKAAEDGAIAETAGCVAGGSEYQKQIEQIWVHGR